MRQAWMAVLVFAAIGFVTGCSKAPKPQEPPARGLKVTAPGINLSVDPDRGIEFTAPQFDVRIDEDQGAEISGPDVRVKAHPKDGADVTTRKGEVKLRR